jgi:hypothetical protein
MDQAELLRKTREAFTEDVAATPALTLRGANAVDSYDHPEPFDASEDEETDEYLEGFAFWAMPYLDARSWRHYLPRLIEYAFEHPQDPRMVVEATVRSLRPPDRVPRRLTTLTADQEAVIVAFLERLALGDEEHTVANDAREALQEWWLPGAHLRPARGDGRAARGPVTYVEVGDRPYHLTIPDTLEGGEVHVVPTEHRTVQVWRGPVYDDALVDVFVNAYALSHRSFRDAEESAARWLTPETRAWVDVAGARKAVRLDGTTYRYIPAEPEHTTMVIALGDADVVTLTVRGTERVDVQAELDRIIRSFALRDVPTVS